MNLKKKIISIYLYQILFTSFFVICAILIVYNSIIRKYDWIVNFPKVNLENCSASEINDFQKFKELPLIARADFYSRTNKQAYFFTDNNDVFIHFKGSAIKSKAYIKFFASIELTPIQLYEKLDSFSLNPESALIANTINTCKFNYKNRIFYAYNLYNYFPSANILGISLKDNYINNNNKLRIYYE